MLFPSCIEETIFEYYLRAAVFEGWEFRFDWMELHLDVICTDAVFVGRRKDGRIRILEHVPLNAAATVTSPLQTQIPTGSFPVTFENRKLDVAIDQVRSDGVIFHEIYIEYLSLLELMELPQKTVSDDIRAKLRGVRRSNGEFFVDYIPDIGEEKVCWGRPEKSKKVRRFWRRVLPSLHRPAGEGLSEL